MYIAKVINNNIISAFDDNKEELILMGRGLGFHSRAGQEICMDKVEKIFRLKDESDRGKLTELLGKMPLEHIQISVKIIDYAKQVLKNRMNPNIYITLTDHIDFVLQRVKAGIDFPNPLLWEVKTFYPSEYLIGEYAISLIRKELGVELKNDEAASVALHLVNAEYNTDMNNTMKITSTIHEVLKIIEDYMGTALDENSLHYSRLVTHLKFLVHRIFTNQILDDGETELSEMIRRMYPDEYGCSERIAAYISDRYETCTISQDEITYLAVHIRRVFADLYKLDEQE